MIKNLNKLFPPLKMVELNYVSGDFFPHVEIRNGVICFDEDVQIECLLHEIGHLALVPSGVRKRIDGDIDFTTDEEDQLGKFYFTGNEDHLIVWQKCVTEQLKLPEQCKYLEKSDEKCYQIVDRESIEELFNRLEMGFDSVSGTFENVVSPL